MKIVFMGTPDFAVPSLKALISAGHEVVGVFCQPDKPQGRHQVLTPPAVKVVAMEHNIPVFQPNTLRTPEGQAMVAALAPELIVVAAYGKLLPKAVLDMPKYGCINVHGSLLPKYRGAAPIQWAVINGEKEAGVTIMQMAEGMDTGDMLMTAKTEIGADETAGELFDRLSILGAETLVRAVKEIHLLIPVPQNEDEATWAAPLKKEDGALDFSLDAAVVYARMRGVSPWPGGFFFHNGRRVKVLSARLSDENGAAGTLLDQKNFTIACKTGAITLLEVAPEGAKRQSGAAYVNGQRLKVGDVLDLDKN